MMLGEGGQQCVVLPTRPTPLTNIEIARKLGLKTQGQALRMTLGVTNYNPREPGGGGREVGWGGGVDDKNMTLISQNFQTKPKFTNRLYIPENSGISVEKTFKILIF
jgi:hypothetical protein